jgi:cytochrome c-type biogenesis protein CcmH
MTRADHRRSPLAGDALAFANAGSRIPVPGKRVSPASGLLRVVFVALLMCVGFAHAQAIEPMPFTDHAQELRFQHLTHQLRCPMCQNETLADSNAPIARDLRNQIFKLMQQGKSDDEIRQYLVARYSDYILYDPPLKPGTWLLWFGPLLILLGGGAVVVLAIRPRRRDAATTMTVGDSADDGDDW